MKKIVWLLMIMSIFIASVTIAAPPTDGNKVFVVGSDGPFVATLVGDTLNIQVPIPGSQAKLAKNWVLSSGVRAYFDKQGWGEYGSSEIATQVVGKYLKAQIKLNGNKAYRVRIWGKNATTNEWLHIIQSDTYTRLDKNSKPAYELVIADGKVQKVPANYGVWSW